MHTKYEYLLPLPGIQQNSTIISRLLNPKSCQHSDASVKCYLLSVMGVNLISIKQ